jgi:protein farnesyltransferase subunit beta
MQCSNEKEEKKEKTRRTDIDQENTELRVLKYFEEVGFSTRSSEEFNGEAKYYRLLHYNFAKKLMSKLPGGYSSLDSGYPWLLYWVTNIITMCKDNYALNQKDKMQFVQILKELQHEDGGFCGSPKGHAHLISTYAAVMAIVNLGIPEAYDIIDINKMKNFLLKMKNNQFDINQEPSYTDKNGVYLITRDKNNEFISYHTAYPGTFQNHINGESDLRSTYCAMVVASVLNLINYDDLENDPITKGVVNNIKNCQTFEGGLGPEPFCEAHGGYSYCGIATLVLLKKLNEIDTNSFVRWLVNRQMTKEGGFNGRTNKLVDSCYSFWQGSIFNMIYMGDNKFTYDMELLYDQLSLQAYILFACQNLQNGGLIDKPGKFPDLFHTNYATAGLSLSQECLKDNFKVALNSDLDDVFEKMNPIYCVTQEKIEKALKYYANITK